jgi:hypothetical protein
MAILIKTKDFVKLGVKFFSEKAYLLLFFAVYAYSIFWLIWPFFIHNSLFTADIPGHYFSAWYTKEYIFPKISGWNPYFFFGFPQNLFYQPLFTFATVILSFLMPLEYAFKSIVAFSILLLPVSFYYFARSFENIGKIEASSIMVIMFAVLFIFENGVMGGDMFSTFNVGLVANTLGFSLFFFYFGSLKKGFSQGNYLQSAFIFALIILTHTITSIVAILLLSTFAIVHYNKNSLFFSGKQLLLGFLLSAFWLVPAIAYIDYTDLFISGSLPYDLIVLIVSGLATIYLWFSKKNDYLEPSLFAFIVAVLCFVGWNYANYPMHYYRLTMFVVLMLPIVLYGLVKNLFWKKPGIILPIVSILFFLLVVGTLSGLYPEGNIRKPFVEKVQGETSGRVLIYAKETEQAGNHELQHAIPIKYKLYGVKGLFQESSKNSIIARVMEEQQWDSNDFDKNIIREELELLGINYVVSKNQILPEWKDFGKIVSFYFWQPDKEFMEKYTYHIYKANESSLIQVLDYAPKNYLGKDWDLEVINWFGNKNMRRNIFINGKENMQPGFGSEVIRILEKSPTMDRIKFFVESEKRVPIYIKISYFPKWKAYQNGIETPIYKASPNFMIVYGKGEIELRYEETDIEKIGFLLSIIGLIWLVAVTGKKSLGFE